MLLSKILIVSGATIRVIFQNSVTNVVTVVYILDVCQVSASGALVREVSSSQIVAVNM